MNCLRCGFCCIALDVTILVDPNKGWDDEMNYSYKPCGVRCPHLSFDDGGMATCAIHSHPNYIDTPCDRYDQIGKPNADCRMGEAAWSGKVDVRRLYDAASSHKDGCVESEERVDLPHQPED